MKNLISPAVQVESYTRFEPLYTKIVNGINNQELELPEILLISSYPPRQCGIATYSQDLFKSLNEVYINSFSIRICALEEGIAEYTYPDEVKYVLNTTESNQYLKLASTINQDNTIKIVLVQHEFGLFDRTGNEDFYHFLIDVQKPVMLALHTVLPHPDEVLMNKVKQWSEHCHSVLVMTNNAARILENDYGVSSAKIVVIAHGTHLVPHLSKDFLKNKYGIAGRKTLSTFGLLSSGKGIETTLEALPAIIVQNPSVLFLIIGKTHPGVIKSEGEKYRSMLSDMVVSLHLESHVQFINEYLPLKILLEYLQLTDIYLFTSKDPNQAVSGTFSYAASCACPIISTPIPQAKEILKSDTGIIFDFQDSLQLTQAVNRLMSDEPLRFAFSSNTLHRIVPTAWQNSAIAHALLLQNIINEFEPPTSDKKIKENGYSHHTITQSLSLQYKYPDINLEHIKKMTDIFGMIQFAKINQPDIESGYTLDDNARALICFAMYYEWKPVADDLIYINRYVDFIEFCQQRDGSFLNYVDKDQRFTTQNQEANLADANGRAIWALGFLISKQDILPPELIRRAKVILEKTIPLAAEIHSTRAMAFIIKGYYFANLKMKSIIYSEIIKRLADRLLQMYRHESDDAWMWYESYLTYANSILPECMLMAWLDTGELKYKNAAQDSFTFLLSLLFENKGIKVISNKTWLHKGKPTDQYGEQPIDVAYTILALDTFYKTFLIKEHFTKMKIAFDWFLGNNHLNQIMYNPCTGGCYDGLEESHINLNQGAESTLSYLMARLTMQFYADRPPPANL